MKYSTIALGTVIAFSTFCAAVSCYNLYQGKPDTHIKVQLGDLVAKYRVVTHSNGSLTITLLSTLPTGFDVLFHNHLINGTTHGNFRSINEIIHFIHTRHTEVKVYSSEV